MAGIRIDQCYGVKITNCTFDNCDIAIEATNSREVQISKTAITNCDKGIKLDDCWDSEVTETQIENSKSSKGIFRLNILSAIIRREIYR